MPQTKDIGSVAAKWSQRAAAAGADYTAGVKSTTKDWAGLTAAAAPAWEQGVQTAVGNGRFAKGVQKAGTAKWQAGASGKGATRYPQGVTGGGPNYANNFGPFLQVISGVTLPPRGPRGSPSNIQRVSTIADALHAAKLRG
jgi:hypothetical protein